MEVAAAAASEVPETVKVYEQEKQEGAAGNCDFGDEKSWKLICMGELLEMKMYFCLPSLC